MYLELYDISLTGLGVSVDPNKALEAKQDIENVRMNIGAELRFPNEGRVDCLVTVSSNSDSETVKLQCTYVGSFVLTTQTPLAEDDHQKISAACTAKMFPYIRELMADVTRRLPLTAPIQLHPSLGDERTLYRQMTARQGARPDAATAPVNTPQ